MPLNYNVKKQQSILNKMIQGSVWKYRVNFFQLIFFINLVEIKTIQTWEEDTVQINSMYGPCLLPLLLIQSPHRVYVRFIVAWSIMFKFSIRNVSNSHTLLHGCLNLTGRPKRSQKYSGGDRSDERAGHGGSGDCDGLAHQAQQE